MTNRKRILSLFALCLCLLPAARAAWAADQRLSENDLKRLVELQIGEECILAKIQKDGLSFTLDEQALSRLKQAGVPERLLAAAEHASREKTPGTPEPAAEAASGQPIMVWVERQYSYIENPLHTEFSVNGKTVDIFTSDTRKDVGKHLKRGWNTISLKTTPQEPAKELNQLILRIGPVQQDPKSDRLLMKPVLWTLRNGTDWQFKEGKASHRLGPGTKEVTLNYRVYLASLDLENLSMANGDYVLQGNTQYGYVAPALSTTVFVNGAPLTSFLGEDRQIVVTSLLKQGKNDVKMVSIPVKDAMTDSDVTVEVFGPVQYNARTEKFEAKPIVQLKAMQGWEREDRTGQLVSMTDPKVETLERTLPFVLEQMPAVAGTQQPGEQPARR